ncbi:hypothetical protein GGR57DRAFT_481397 [Xylariaceae sp. FL1272]|nr:hypothetical protein GGR57DRAFT_481397 [Xylariaceae sp. FL1272]
MMDDLSGLDWSANNGQGGGNSSNNNTTKSPLNPVSPPPFYHSLRPTPSPQPSGRSTPLQPLSAQPSAASGNANLRHATSKPAADSFSNLVNFGGAKTNANLSLRERQEQLAAEKQRKEQEQKNQLQSQYGGGQFWDSIGRRSTPASRAMSPAVQSPGSGIGATNGGNKDEADDDLFAAFNKDTKVDNASHYPPPADLSKSSAWTTSSSGVGAGDYDDDDDPFGLNQLKTKPNSHTASSSQPQPSGDDDDFLGDLGRPVEEVRRKAQAAQSQLQPGKPIDDDDSESDADLPPNPPPNRQGAASDPFDKAVAELIDMGFTIENARRGLTESGAGLNVQAAVGWLLDDAHRQARNKQNPRGSPADQARRDGSRPRDRQGPGRTRHDDASARPPRQDSQSPAYGDDIQKRAAAVGSSLFKTANSLWKSGQKQVQKAVADFQQEGGDASQPKWMRATQQEQRPSVTRQESSGNTNTDEAMMLESGMRPDRHSTRPAQAVRDSPRDRSPALPLRPGGQTGPPKWQQQTQSSSRSGSADPRARLNKQVIEEQSAQAYVSPARRKKTAPQPAPGPDPEPEVDLLFGSSAPPLAQSRPQRSAQPSPISRPSPQGSTRPIATRPPPTTRSVPSVSATILQASTRHRLDGTAHFKRGDYDAAHTAYTNSLSGIPQSHPLCIVLLTNRALTSLKTGSPKQAVSDADAAIGVIGPSRGEGERVAMPDGESRDMKDLYGKALSRKAEALEQMEKWADASEVWQLCVEAGVGGASATAGRQRCQKALTPKPKPMPRPAHAKPRPKPSVMSDFAPAKSSGAVERLREANKAAEKADDEKFALSEKVDARISLWRDGKRDNLRALLGSMDQVLWENSGWKKVGLHELVMANKVKIHYMKAIAKCHPDKLPQDASTEVQLIAATVFATLNESWDKFKADNGL